MLKRILCVGLFLAFVWPVATPAVAGTVCTNWNAFGTCLVSVDDGSSTTGNGSGGGSGSAACVDKQGNTMPCTNPSWGWWSNTNACYIKVVDPQPNPTDVNQSGTPVGLHPSQLLYSCLYYGDQRDGSFPFMWLPAAAATPDPAVLARQAISQMNLTAVTVGVVPDPVPGRVGIIGMPTWMWADAPTESTIGPITRSASAGGYTVTATATVKRIVWNMGDGSSVTCNGPGTKYEDRYGKSSSPTCGYTYTRQGVYTVTATSYWEVAWSGIGQSGTIALNFSRSATITMGEVQVLSH